MRKKKIELTKDEREKLITWIYYGKAWLIVENAKKGENPADPDFIETSDEIDRMAKKLK